MQAPSHAAAAAPCRWCRWSNVLQQQSDVIQLKQSNTPTSLGATAGPADSPALLRGTSTGMAAAGPWPASSQGRALLADAAGGAAAAAGEQPLRLPSAYTLWDLQLSIIILFAGLCVVTVCQVLAWRLIKLMDAESKWPR
jgi:hypothetical protein